MLVEVTLQSDIAIKMSHRAQIHRAKGPQATVKIDVSETPHQGPTIPDSPHERVTLVNAQYVDAAMSSEIFLLGT